MKNPHIKKKNWFKYKKNEVIKKYIKKNIY